MSERRGHLHNLWPGALAEAALQRVPLHFGSARVDAVERSQQAERQHHDQHAGTDRGHQLARTVQLAQSRRWVRRSGGGGGGGGGGG